MLTGGSTLSSNNQYDYGFQMKVKRCLTNWCLVDSGVLSTAKCHNYYHKQGRRNDKSVEYHNIFRREHKTMECSNVRKHALTGKKMSVKTELVIEDSPFWINQDLNG